MSSKIIPLPKRKPEVHSELYRPHQHSDPLDLRSERPLSFHVGKNTEEDDEDEGGRGTLRDPLIEERLGILYFNALQEDLRSFAKVATAKIDPEKQNPKETGDLSSRFQKTHPLAREAQFSGISDKKNNPIVSDNENAKEKLNHELKLQYQKQYAHQFANSPHPTPSLTR